MKKSMQLLGAVVLTFVVGAAQAIPLSGLLGGQSITVGDKVFDNWDYDYFATDVLREFNPNNISVEGIDDGGDYGLLFTALNDELTVSGDGEYAFVDLTLSFRASVLPDAGMLITDTALLYGASTLLHPSPFLDVGVFINEYIDSTAGEFLGYNEVEFSQLDVDGDGIGELTTDFIASAEFSPQSEIWVTKNILVWASNEDDEAQLETFSQRFSQTPVPVPAPLALLALGLIGLGWSRRRN